MNTFYTHHDDARTSSAFDDDKTLRYRYETSSRRLETVTDGLYQTREIMKLTRHLEQRLTEEQTVGDRGIEERFSLTTTECRRKFNHMHLETTPRALMFMIYQQPITKLDSDL